MTIKPTLGARGAVLLLAIALPAWAGDDHDHGAAAPAEAGKPLPVVTAVSESFELVGRLYPDELSILIDRASTTEPVLNASLTVDVAGRSIAAPFHADHGDYSLSDPEALAKLHQLGSKPLSFTLVAGNDRDRLSGELAVHDAGAAAETPRLGGMEYVLWAGLAGAGLALLGLLMRQRRAFRNSRLGGAE